MATKNWERLYQSKKYYNLLNIEPAYTLFSNTALSQNKKEDL